MAKPHFRPASEQVAAAVQANGMSLTREAVGAVYRESQRWDVSKEWSGRPLTSWRIRRSKWTKTLQINLYVALNAEAGNLFAFQVHLDPAMTDAEAEQQAQVWLTVLNLRRKE